MMVGGSPYNVTFATYITGRRLYCYYVMYCVVSGDFRLQDFGRVSLHRLNSL